MAYIKPNQYSGLPLRRQLGLGRYRTLGINNRPVQPKLTLGPDFPLRCIRCKSPRLPWYPQPCAQHYSTDGDLKASQVHSLSQKVTISALTVDFKVTVSLWQGTCENIVSHTKAFVCQFGKVPWMDRLLLSALAHCGEHCPKKLSIRGQNSYDTEKRTHHIIGRGLVSVISPVLFGVHPSCPLRTKGIPKK